MPTLLEIEARAKLYAEARASLAETVSSLNAGIEALKRGAMPDIKRAISRASTHHDRLRALIEESKGLFAKPKTRVFCGIKCGFAKGKGKLQYKDADQVVKLIKKHFPEQADVLITTIEKPAKDALNNLPASDLKKLGIEVVDGGEAIYIKPSDSAVDKMVDALLDEATEEIKEAA